MSETSIFFGAEFWVLVAFVLFGLLLLRMRVHKSAVGSLDHRADKIRSELAQAKSLREEAQRLLAEYEARRAEAEKEAEALIAAARNEAEMLSAEAKAKAEDFVRRRTQMAEGKIAQAEAQAVADVRSAAAEAATEAARIVLAAQVKGKAADDLIERSIAQLKPRFQ
jgi:F-type H+-transporting ATPase subunit b